jgi:hypothetical protein
MGFLQLLDFLAVASLSVLVSFLALKGELNVRDTKVVKIRRTLMRVIVFIFDIG